MGGIRASSTEVKGQKRIMTRFVVDDNGGGENKKKGKVKEKKHEPNLMVSLSHNPFAFRLLCACSLLAN